MMLKQLSDTNRYIFETGLSSGLGWEDIAHMMIIPSGDWPGVRNLYFKTIRNRRVSGYG